MKDVKLQKKCVIPAHGTVEHAVCELELTHGWRGRVHLISEDVNLKDVKQFSYGD